MSGARSTGGGAAVGAVADVVDDLRRRITLITGEAQPAASAPAPVNEPVPATTATLGVPAWLGRHLTRGGLPRGAVTEVTACPTALVDLLATVTAAGGCAAVVDYPQLSLAAVAATGGDLDRTVLIPDATPHTGAVLGTLVEGLDLVIYRVVTPVTPTAARPVEARLRRSRCALVVCGGWPGARLHLDWQVEGVTGLGRGSGRIRGVTLTGRAHGQGQPPVTFREQIGDRAGTVAEHLPAPLERAR
ncbi:hypothetical protein [Corynebacterium terpenotabidum]|uniref:Uncharacterized protein n=1 Tax=Corynebacterium terpenotabidum Y-11 TaxID=1200352 RepID=S4XIH0_9CORY|nr:hypothetical protein [Corynebacterium terpenotabidum]AGP31490.1 hypothetical protein A606_09245 [Corynebacterium terpenotabidum Y-11]